MHKASQIRLKQVHSSVQESKEIYLDGPPATTCLGLATISKVMTGPTEIVSTLFPCSPEGTLHLSRGSLLTRMFVTLQNKVATPTGAESPTTARPFEMDDDDVQESGVIGGDRNASPAFGDASGDVPPPKPPRPLTETQKNTNTLKEAFPTVDEGVIKAVLRASGGKVEPAFNALLGELPRGHGCCCNVDKLTIDKK